MGMESDQPFAAFEDFLGRVHPEDRARVRTAVGNAIREGKPYSADYRMLRAEGTVVTLHVTGEVERDEGGHPLRIMGTAQDITERYAPSRR